MAGTVAVYVVMHFGVHVLWVDLSTTAISNRLTTVYFASKAASYLDPYSDFRIKRTLHGWITGGVSREICTCQSPLEFSTQLWLCCQQFEFQLVGGEFFTSHFCSHFSGAFRISKLVFHSCNDSLWRALQVHDLDWETGVCVH